tara:strand:- start:12 stop:635 length:624 start_codon:yes stop_codon:yes gene_type:complete
MKIKILNHPLINLYMTILRSKDTKSAKFRFLARKISSLMAFEIFKDLEVLPKIVETPLEKYYGVTLSDPKPCIISILRAGLIMSEGIIDIFDEVSIGHIGMYRDEKTLKPINYIKKLPSDLQNRQCYLCDPMLATGGSAISAINTLKDHLAIDIKLICLLASDPGIKKVQDNFPEVEIICAQKDDKLNEDGFILPGLGDAGDRIFET